MNKCRKSAGACNRMMAVMLTLTLAISMFSSGMTAFALDEVPAPGTQDARQEFSEYGDDLLTSSAGMWVLEQLAAGAVSYVGGMAMEEAMGQMFGKPPDQISNLVSEFQELKKDIKDIKAQIDNLSAKIDQANLKNDLRAYATLINGYAGVYEHLCGSLDAYSDDELTGLFLTELYKAADANFKVDGKSIIESTLTLGNYLTKPYPGNNYNTFGAFDKLDRFINRWEHQGYAQRKAFREKALYTYAMFSTMSQMACKLTIENNQGDTAAAKLERIKAKQWLTQLEENAATVNEMNKRCAVIEHPDLRIYRDTKMGVDLYKFYKSVQRSYMYSPGLSEWNKYASSLKMLSDPKFLFPVTKTDSCRSEDWSNGFALYSNQPSIAMYKRIYEDYKADNGGKHISLHDIFFDSNKGNFTKPSGTTSRYFATHAYEWKQETGKTVEIIGGKSYEKWTTVAGKWTTYLMDGAANPDKKTLIDATYGSPIKVKERLAGSVQYLSPLYYYGTVQQGELMLPGEELTPEPEDGISGMNNYYVLPYEDTVTLSVEEKLGYTYQWYMNPGDGNGYREIDGATGLTYNLPPLSPEMNGYKYICDFIPNDGTEENYLSTAPVTLNLDGEGVAVSETVHAVNSAEELEEALEKVSNGDWDGHTLKLTASIQYHKPITLIGRYLTLDLNGHELHVEPAATVEPNINPMSSSPKIAAVYVGNNGSLGTINSGSLNIVAGDGIAYGVYAEGESGVQADNIISRNGGTAVHSSSGRVAVKGNLTAEGEKSVGIRCVDGGSIDIDGNVTVSGAASYGVLLSSSNGTNFGVTINGSISVNGSNSRGVYLDTAGELVIKGDVTVINGIVGISAEQGKIVVNGNVTAQNSAINARNDATIQIQGNVISTGDEITAVSAFGANLRIGGNIISSGSGGTGIAAARSLIDPTQGAQIIVDGKINASTHLSIENAPIKENGYVEQSTMPGYYTFTDEVNVVWTKQNSSFPRLWIWILLGGTALVLLGGAVLIVRKRRYRAVKI